MTHRFTIQLTKTIRVTVDADTEQEAVDEAVNGDDINNGEWERAEHKVKVLGASQLDFDLQFQRIKEDAHILELAELYDPE